MSQLSVAVMGVTVIRVTKAPLVMALLPRFCQPAQLMVQWERGQEKIPVDMKPTSKVTAALLTKVRKSRPNSKLVPYDPTMLGPLSGPFTLHSMLDINNRAGNRIG